MLKEINRQQGDTIGGVDYSYDQWRHAQMLQLEFDHRALCRHEESQLTSGGGAGEAFTARPRVPFQ